MSFTDNELIISMILFIAVISVSPRKYISILSVLFILFFLFIYFPFSSVVFILTSVFTFFLFQMKKETLLIPGIILLVLIFFLFKIHSFGGTMNPILAWGYPVGLSYFIVRQIHFLFEAYKENITEISFWDYISYTGFFPAFFIGPIHRLPEFLRDLKSGSFSARNLSAGLERILYGYVKIVFFAQFIFMDYFAFRLKSIKLTDPSLFQYLDCIRYGGNLYFQFAGYTDIAIGASLIAGFQLKENFNFPFLAKNINDFWKRWHISLSDWCKDYVFKPVYAQSRLFPFSIILTMLAIGLWHEFSIRYVIWALYHGIGIAVWQYFDKNKKFRIAPDQKILKSLINTVSVLFTLNFVILSFCITKEKTFSDGYFAFLKLLHLHL